MAANSRPSLDVLVPLVMIENNITNDNSDNLPCEPQKDVLRHFDSGDIVLVRLDSQCLPAIVFNISGLVMKFDIDRQLYHVCLLDKEFTEQWVDAIDMIIYSVPMIAECENEQIMHMWSTANELLEIRNNDDDKTRLEEFKRRFSEARQQKVPLSSMNTSKKNRQSRTSSQKVSSQITYAPLTTCEELHVIDSIYRLSHCTYAEAKRIAEDTYMKIVCTNNRENIQSCSMGIISDQWFLTFAIRKIDYLRQYSTIWLPDLETMIDISENENELNSLISLMKKSV
ncbi:unnamed protein product [Rotaria sp. Silwood2]|nr:unnamed protein product [Rotaria sp. Silwood2]CAF2528724.1 unnamed protein product [Rotaria sp. Silwood2]CAF2761905.1 unnamed protein product [Rotaria sp. Silwood2]CAF2939583.1 unnamed protein product [Rotaria sp. Silwood2]CAF3907182.1 unnamed protein product [Rotaria sp. Silwood2]